MNSKINWFNPFCPHIVEFNSGKFAVRKLQIMGWYYYDNQTIKKDDYWWWAGGKQEDCRRYYEVDSLEIAQTLLEMCKLHKQIKSRQVARIYK